jgi:hypothetical protein
LDCCVMLVASGGGLEVEDLAGLTHHTWAGMGFWDGELRSRGHGVGGWEMGACVERIGWHRPGRLLLQLLWGGGWLVLILFLWATTI